MFKLLNQASGDIPYSFTYPFYYRPHPLATKAADNLQTLIETSNWSHDFTKIGKMFGVLVCKNQKGQLGYLAAVSGDLQDSDTSNILVPSVNQKVDEAHDKISVQLINEKILKLQVEPQFIKLQKLYEKDQHQYKHELSKLKQKQKLAKKDRDLRRSSGEDQKKLNQESINFKKKIKYLKETQKNSLNAIHKKIQKHKAIIISLEEKRKIILKNLQTKKFNSYKFLDANRNSKDLIDIFNNFTPPSGTGDCAAPKLLQYAYKNNFKPICMAEFWWGAPHKSAIRKHKNFYPSCRSKCGPILNHMLKGLKVDDNPMLKNYGANKQVKIIFEDSDIIIIDKPSGLLSVPGKKINDSVQSRFPNYMIIHRLDQETSGLMIMAKNKNAHKIIQMQFIQRSVKKQYLAILNGLVELKEGLIELPLRLDLDNRPKQLVCYDNGKNASTKYHAIKHIGNSTLIKLFPKTGRTHQLRVHCAHQFGLNTPIIGDTLYGCEDKRLYLNAQIITFMHPTSKKEISFESQISFDLISKD